MKVFIVLLSVSTAALASLEPPGYRSPGSYLPPHLQYQQDHHYHHHLPQQSNPSLSTSSEYLPPSLNRSPASPSFSSQYHSPRNHHYNQQQHQFKQDTSVPSSNYLPIIDKQNSVSPSPYSSDYATTVFVPGKQHLQNQSTPLLNNYLPPSVSTVSTPSNEYVSALPNKQLSVPTNTLKTNYLPPLLNGQLTPSSDYVPPRNLDTISSIAVPTISVLSVSPYKLDGSAYSKPQQQSKFSRSGLDKSSLPQESRYPSSNHNFVPKNLRLNGFNQPADNYLPPIQSVRNSYDLAETGYQYTGAAFAGVHREQDMEAAKYDFEYRVSDEFGNDYAHKESRMGNQIQGVYSVLLPDGRKQIVHYEANEDGFKPRISYEEVASVLSSKAPAVVADVAFTGYNKNNNGLDTQGPY